MDGLVDQSINYISWSNRSWIQKLNLHQRNRLYPRLAMAGWGEMLMNLWIKCVVHFSSRSHHLSGAILLVSENAPQNDPKWDRLVGELKMHGMAAIPFGRFAIRGWCRGFLSHDGVPPVPQSSSILDWDFPYKPSSELGYPRRSSFSCRYNLSGSTQQEIIVMSPFRPK